MEIFYCIMFFCMGAVFGSFFTLAVYRIPLGLDITHERSFCPNCNHRLEFIDLIPILSYLSLGGKCRYCGKPVRIRYLLLEVASGCVFVIAYLAFGLHFPFLELDKVSLMIAFVMFYVTNAIILGIDKEYHSIDKRVLLFGLICEFLYMLYLYVFLRVNMYRYGIYLMLLYLAVLLETVYLVKWKREAIHTYWFEILELSVFEMIFLDDIKMILEMLLGSILIWIIYNFYLRVKKKKSNVPLGFCIAMSSIAVILIENFIRIGA